MAGTADLTPTSLVALATEMLESLHREFRSELSDLRPEELHEPIGPDTSTIAMLIAHTVGAAREILATVGNETVSRYRPAEFADRLDSREDLVRMLDEEDLFWRRLAPRITADDLLAERGRANSPTPRSGLYNLVMNYGHEREHFAQLKLTKQLLRQRANPAAHGGPRRQV